MQIWRVKEKSKPCQENGPFFNTSEAAVLRRKSGLLVPETATGRQGQQGKISKKRPRRVSGTVSEGAGDHLQGCQRASPRPLKTVSREDRSGRCPATRRHTKHKQLTDKHLQKRRKEPRFAAHKPPPCVRGKNRNGRVRILLLYLTSVKITYSPCQKIPQRVSMH